MWVFGCNQIIQPSAYLHFQDLSITSDHQILKKNEQMYFLLAISLSLYLHPKLVEENVNNQLWEKYAKKMLHMQHRNEAMFDELFCYACPDPTQL
jgi:hypothetical protein